MKVKQIVEEPPATSTSIKKPTAIFPLGNLLAAIHHWGF
jgi:hypothetical protein